MILLQISGGQAMHITLDDGMSAAELVQQVKDDNNLEFLSGWQLQDTHDGHTLATNEIVTDSRLYYLNVWAQKRASV